MAHHSPPNTYQAASQPYPTTVEISALNALSPRSPEIQFVLSFILVDEKAIIHSAVFSQSVS